nr:MAG TPA: hypothetical protein [Caudoviricetes sp.]
MCKNCWIHIFSHSYSSIVVLSVAFSASVSSNSVAFIIAAAARGLFQPRSLADRFECSFGYLLCFVAAHREVLPCDGTVPYGMVRALAKDLAPRLFQVFFKLTVSHCITCFLI